MVEDIINRILIRVREISKKKEGPKMVLKQIIDSGSYWVIILGNQTGEAVHVQRKGITSGADTLLSAQEELICALCRHILQANIKGDIPIQTTT